MPFDDLSPLLPLDCFAFSLTLPRVEKASDAPPLPQLGFLSAERSFAEVGAGYNSKGLYFWVHVKKPFEEAHFPRYEQGDAFELFIDTRDLKSAGFVTKFCHHFVFLPQEIDGVRAQEITHFRTEDRHELCDPKALRVQTEFKRKSYALEIFIPSQCLHGYDQATFKRIGLTYVVHRFGGEPQHFALSSKYMALPEHPGLWASVQLT
jgi:hypothetical protein